MAKTLGLVEGRVASDLIETDPLIDVVVTRHGNLKISTGRHHNAGGEELAERGETLRIHKSNAEALRDLGWVDFEDDVPEKPKRSRVAAHSEQA
jgi:hypothetical protein